MPAPGENPALDAETRVPVLIAVSVAMIVASLTIVSLRLFTRYAVVKALGLDDLAIVIAVVLSLGVSVTTIIQAQNGLGQHVWVVTDQDTNMRQLKALFACEVLYNLAQIITKLSFLLQFQRIFKDRLTRSVCTFFFCFLGVWGVVQEFLVGFACMPFQEIVPDHATHCIETLVVWYLTSVVNILTDFIIFLTPMPAIKHLQLLRKQKIMVGGIFCLGFFTCIISIVRLCFLKVAVNTQDPTWDNVPTSYWSVVELNCGIICASLATLRPLLRKIIPGLSRPSDAIRFNTIDELSTNKANLITSTHHDGPDPITVPEKAPSSNDTDIDRPSGLQTLDKLDSDFSIETRSDMRLPRQSNRDETPEQRQKQRDSLRALGMPSVEEELKMAEKAEADTNYEDNGVGVKPKAAAVTGLWSVSKPGDKGGDAFKV